MFYFLGGDATFFLSLSVNPCSTTGSGFPDKGGLKNCRTVRYPTFSVLQLESGKIDVLFFRFYVIQHRNLLTKMAFLVGGFGDPFVLALTSCPTLFVVSASVPFLAVLCKVLPAVPARPIR